MAIIENALGKIIQISNSKRYLELREKYDLTFNRNFENLFMSIDNYATTLAEVTDGDVDKVKLYTKVYALGEIDGGKTILDFINERIVDNNKKIRRSDIAIKNLKDIFSNLETTFSSEQLIEVTQLLQGNPKTKETSIVDISLKLKSIFLYLENSGNNSELSMTNFVFNEIRSISEYYKKSGNVSLNPKLIELAETINSQKNKVSIEDEQRLSQLVDDYNTNVITKDSLLRRLNDFRLSLEKKTKVR